MGYFTGEISQIFRILDALGTNQITTAELWRKSKVHHARGQSMLNRLQYLGYIKSEDAFGKLLKRGVSKLTNFWTITPDGQIFKMALELYVKP